MAWKCFPPILYRKSHCVTLPHNFREPHVVYYQRGASDNAVGGRRSDTPRAARPRSVTVLHVSKVHWSFCPPSPRAFLQRDPTFLPSTSSPAATGDATIPILTNSDSHECPCDEPSKTVGGVIAQYLFLAAARRTHPRIPH